MKRERIVPLSLFLMCLAVAMSSSWGADGLANSAVARSARLIRAANTDVSSKVTLCHIPPWDPDNPHTIVVGQAAVAAHLAHGDYLGACHPACQVGVPSPVSKTGQTGCWDQVGNGIDCAGTGQDGAYQKGVSADPRFADNGDGTVTDNLTGLIWLQNANCFDNQYWDTALSDANTLADGECGLTDGSVAGDWRLPNVKELQSLIDFGQFGPALPTGHPFSGDPGFNYYWSSTPYVENPVFAWYVRLNDGGVHADVKHTYFWVWPVRGGQ